MRQVLLLEDDAFLADSISAMLQELGISCSKFSSVRAIESQLAGSAPGAVIADMAVPLNRSKLISAAAAHGGSHGGQAVLRYARQRWSTTPMALITGKPSAETRHWCESNGIDYFLKPVEKSTFERFLGKRNPRAFVVHGRNMKALSSVKSALRALRIKPIVLMECASLGRTVIEKFEEVSGSCDCALVVVSPDDIGRLAAGSRARSRFRARQNVLFELGYFYGALGRRSGAVVLVEYGDTEIPSDLAGIVRLDGQVPGSELKKSLRAELANILQ